MKKHIDVPVLWALAACNGRMYIGRLWKPDEVEDPLPREIHLAPAYELVLLQTPTGPIRGLNWPFFHASIEEMVLPNPTIITLDRLWPKELEFYEDSIRQCEENRVQARRKSFILES